MTTIGKIIKPEFYSAIISSIRNALIETGEMVDKLQITKLNGISFITGNIIHRNLKRCFSEMNVDIIDFMRGNWAGEIIDDVDNYLTFSIIRVQRFISLSSEIRNDPHYLDVILNIQNTDLEAREKQLRFEGTGFDFDNDVINEQYKFIMGCEPEGRTDYHHCIITYNSVDYELTSVNIFLLDKDWGIVEDISLDKYIKPDFTSLSVTQTNEENNNEPESKSSGMLLKPKRSKTNTSNSPIILSDQEKQA
jgi:hypothetical protein